MSTTRRGFLGFLAAAGIAAVAGPVVEAAPAPALAPHPKPGERYDTYTFKRQPGFFDLICYVGTGAAITLPNNMGDEIGCVLVKCRTKPQNWLLLEGDAAELTLPADYNEAGQAYIAYQFGKSAMPQIQPYLAAFKELQQ